MDFNVLLKWLVLLTAYLKTTNASVTPPSHLHVSPSWRCENGKCVKEIVQYATSERLQSLNACKLLCSNESVLWPLPQHMEIKGPAVEIEKVEPIVISYGKTGRDYPEATKLVRGAEEIFRGRLKAETPPARRSEKRQQSKNDINTLKIYVMIEDPEITRLTLKTDESYFLEVEKISSHEISAAIKGETLFGVRHGLETLAQVIVYDSVSGGLIMPANVEIDDWPVYPYRGLMLDTARNYFSVESIKRTIDAMAASKMNSFHWHITDSQSFPLKLKDYPEFADYGAYSPEKIYTEEDIVSLLEYAAVRGVRIIPELDAPAHTGAGWQWTPEGTILCYNKMPWSSYCLEPPCGQLNPLGEHVYDILGKLYSSIVRLFQPDMFHMGGDEIHAGCWKSDRQLREWMKRHQEGDNTENFFDKDTTFFLDDEGLVNKEPDDDGFYKLWIMFQNNAFARFNESTAGTTLVKPEPVIWTSDLTKEPYIDKLNSNDYIVQVWSTAFDPTLTNLLDKNIRVILSNHDALYLDCGFGNWIGGGDNWCSPYKNWQLIYENRPIVYEALDDEKRKLILGQEAPLWTESAGEQTLDARLWPRVAALAERTWTNPKDAHWRAAEGRMIEHRERLVRMGIAAETLKPEWCLQNGKGCSSPP